MIRFEGGKISFKYDEVVSTTASCNHVNRRIRVIIDFSPRGYQPSPLVGQAICDSRNNFDKECGRKLALKHAVKSLPKEMRTRIWKAYFGRKNLNV